MVRTESVKVLKRSPRSTSCIVQLLLAAALPSANRLLPVTAHVLPMAIWGQDSGEERNSTSRLQAVVPRASELGAEKSRPRLGSPSGLPVATRAGGGCAANGANLATVS